MQEFFMDYGLWLLIALLVVIGLVFLLSGKGKAEEPVAPPAPPVAETTPPIAGAAPEPEPAPIPASPAVIERKPVEEPAPAPQPTAISPAATVPPAETDDLLKLKGVGPKLGALLLDLGVTRFAQIAAWTDADIAAIDARLGNFRGRPVRDQWVDQAKYLASGDIAGFEAKYGKL
ncbi:putative flap endonuclease-1-like 5' DNA nuclease [Sphingobium sp. OAS761]|uniref:hypothetical protein n=1 Tax=Sphingobium sp. OAS761 TaxID=2817901 RepID=UPI0020A1E339|nr:hypothetical protein [Sphingobium sp. OAS761]MCP1470047.1 putative flap endonuclease-1-like 5' DNA nuclease [Sphingobium sp. OAS761]